MAAQDPTAEMTEAERAAAAFKRDSLRDWKVYLIVGGAFMFLALVLWAGNVRLAPVTSDKPGRTYWLVENFGQFGDAMAPITAVASIASFFVVFVALLLQTTELRLQRRELRLQRKALKLQRDEMAGQRTELEAQTKQMTRTAWQQRRAAVALEGAAKAQVAAANAQSLQAQTARRDAQRAVVLKLQADVAELIRHAEQSTTRWRALLAETSERDTVLLAVPGMAQTAEGSITRFSLQAMPDLRRVEKQALAWLSKIDDERQAKEDAELIDGAGAGGKPSAPWWWRVDLPDARNALAEARHMFNMMVDACRHLDESQLRASEAHNAKMLAANAQTAEALTRAAKMQEAVFTVQREAALRRRQEADADELLKLEAEWVSAGATAEHRATHMERAVDISRDRSVPATRAVAEIAAFRRETLPRMRDRISALGAIARQLALGALEAPEATIERREVVHVLRRDFAIAQEELRELEAICGPWVRDYDAGRHGA